MAYNETPLQGDTMLSQSNIDQINDQISAELRDLRFTRNDDRRRQHLQTIKELKAVLDEREPKQDDEIQSLVESVRDLIRSFRR
jgi:hypothetical protein